ncbi:MAG: hypothetical protein MUO33_12030 [Sedimentisphaerales bacterium]|nr:hypothetical protein [Sedimentisphaerales bacterium]
MAKGKESKLARLRFRPENLPMETYRKLLECFSRELRIFLESAQAGKEGGRKTIMEKVAGASGEKLDPRRFDELLKGLYKEGYLRIGYHRLSEAFDKLRSKEEKFGLLENVTVVGGSDPNRFAQAAAEDLITRMFEISKIKAQGSHHSGERVLNVGIVSGNTTGQVIRAVMKLDWKKDLDVAANTLPELRVFALNVCLTVPEHLAGNATILAYQLAEKINSEAGQDKAHAYGLSAPLLVERQRLEEVDQAPQTLDVLQFTEPYRVRRKLEELGKLKKQPEPNDTELDIVLTGVGELPMGSQGGQDVLEEKKLPSGSQGSIFYNLAKQFGFKMDNIISKERIVGDIAFTAIRADGEPVMLRKRSQAGRENLEPADTKSHTDEETEHVFYSAVQVPVLETMASNKNKSVLLVAQHSEGKYKVPAIFASIAGEHHRYASRLVIDEVTCQKLLHY